MSSAGWGGPGNGQQGPDQQGWNQQGQNHPGGWQAPPPPPQSAPPAMGAPGYGGTGQHGPAGPGYGGPSGPHGPYGPHGPSGPGGTTGPSDPYGPTWPHGPGGVGQQPQRKRPWALITVALGCVLAMVLVVGGGITYLVLSRGGEETPVASDPPPETDPVNDPETDPGSESPSQDVTTPPEEEGSGFEVVSPIDLPPGDVDDMRAVLEDNPLVHGTLPSLPECELPDTPISPTPEQLQAVLNASSTCLNRIWATASSDRGLPWAGPSVVVYTYPDIPADSSCDSSFEEDFPRMCNLDNTVYWPIGYGTALDFPDAADVPGAYLWDLAFIYQNAVGWQSSMSIYYGTMRDMLEDGNDEELLNESWRRYSLQMQCVSSAVAMQVPSGAEPTPALREALTKPESWVEGEPPYDISPENRAKWLEIGFSSGGDLSACNTWLADVEQVS